jgi:hypothetical protein
MGFYCFINSSDCGFRDGWVIHNNKKVIILTHHQIGTGIFVSLSPEITLLILDNAGLQDIVIWGSLNTIFRHESKTLIRRHFAKLLRPFFGDTLTPFFRMLRLSNSVISGSLALSMMLMGGERPNWTPRDMDICVPKFQAKWVSRTLGTAYGFVEHIKADNANIVTEEDAAMDERSDSDNDSDLEYERYDNKHIDRIIRLRNGNKSIDLIISTSQYALLPILQFHSTEVMNFISVSGFASMYPRLTLCNRGLINPMVLENGKPSIRTDHAITKYENRGFIVQRGPYTHRHHLCTRDPICCLTSRYSMDTFTLAITFGDRITHDNHRRVHPARYAARWILGGYMCNEHISNIVGKVDTINM